MKRIKSGEGATDFGQSSGLTQEQLLGRAEPLVVDGPPPDIAHFFEDNGPVPLRENKWARPNAQERIAELIHIELVKDEISQDKIKSIGFQPSWISRAAEAIVQEYL